MFNNEAYNIEIGVVVDAADISSLDHSMCRLNGRNCFYIIDIEIAINRKTTKELRINMVRLTNNAIKQYSLSFKLKRFDVDVQYYMLILITNYGYETLVFKRVFTTFGLGCNNLNINIHLILWPMTLLL